MTGAKDLARPSRLELRQILTPNLQAGKGPPRCHYVTAGYPQPANVLRVRQLVTEYVQAQQLAGVRITSSIQVAGPRASNVGINRLFDSLAELEKHLASRADDAGFRAFADQIAPLLAGIDVEVREVLIPMNPPA